MKGAYILILALLLLGCGKDHERRKLLEGKWQRTGEVTVSDYDRPLNSIVFDPVTGCYVHDIFSYTSNGKYRVENNASGCWPLDQTYDYSFDPDESVLIIYDSGGNPWRREVIVLTDAELIVKAKLISGSMTSGIFTRFARK